MAEAQRILQVTVGRIREFWTGLLMPTRGGCVCDPVAFERDARIRMLQDAVRGQAPVKPAVSDDQHAHVSSS